MNKIIVEPVKEIFIKTHFLSKESLESSLTFVNNIEEVDKFFRWTVRQYPSWATQVLSFCEQYLGMYPYVYAEIDNLFKGASLYIHDKLADYTTEGHKLSIDPISKEFRIDRISSACGVQTTSIVKRKAF